ncbi:MAG TPA: hypothetical protein V6D20_07785 [Candidatus Obscuribacterales bacterium]
MAINDLRPLERLRRLYSSGVVAAAVIYFLRNRDATGCEVNVDDLQEKLQQENSEISRQEVIDVLKKLQELGLGRFWTGRRGKPSRFQPYGSFSSLGSIVLDESSNNSVEDEISISSSLDIRTQESGNEVGCNHISHSYVLRPDYKVEFELPSDLNTIEAERLAAYIKTLPFDKV